MVLDIEQKTCPKCGVGKPRSQFSRCSSKRDGLQSHCKQCKNKHRNEWRKDNRDLFNAQSREYAARTADRIKERRAVIESRQPPCGVPGCPNKKTGCHSYLCHKHANRVYRSGSVGVPGNILQVGENAPRWVGDECSYSGVHGRLRRNLGPASSLSCVDCGGPAAQWSYGGTDPDEKTQPQKLRSGVVVELPYSTNLEHYAPRCVPCHKSFDLGRAI